MPPKYKPLVDKFLERVLVSNGCWEWMSSKMPSGYGYIRDWREGAVYAHRLSYEIFVGPIPEGFHVDHLCRNKSCVNPKHLEAVTPRENMYRHAIHLRRVAFSKLKNDVPVINNNRMSSAKLTPEDVDAIRKSMTTHKEAALLYGVHESTICDIRNYRRWNYGGKSS